MKDEIPFKIRFKMWRARAFGMLGLHRGDVRIVGGILAVALVIVIIILVRRPITNWIEQKQQEQSGKIVSTDKETKIANVVVDESLTKRISEADLSVLFIGNDYSNRPDIGRVTEKMIRSTHPEMDLCFVSKINNGMPLTAHAETESTQKLVAAGPWDYIVLQGGRNRTIMAGAKGIAGLDSISKETKIVLYSLWARRIAYANSRPIYDRHVALAKSMDAGVIPVGMAWLDCSETRGDIRLYGQDGDRSSTFGSYLTCCSIYCYLMNADCDEINDIGLEPAQAVLLTPEIRDRLEAFAWQAHQTHAVAAPDKNQSVEK